MTTAPASAAPARLSLYGTEAHALPAARVQAALARLRGHLATEGDVLVDCAAWLGDEKWRLLAQSFVATMTRAEEVGRWQRALLTSLHRLMSLDFANDEAEGEVGWFATLDLADPKLVRCCQHSEALGTLRAALDAQDVARRTARRVHRPAA